MDNTPIKVSVKDYGAIGNGYADDSQAFIKAISNASVIYVPKGFYNLSNVEISLPSPTTFIGEDAEILNANIVAPYGITVENIIFNGGTNRQVVYSGFPSSMQNKEVIIYSTPKDGASIVYKNCVFKNADIASLAFGGTLDNLIVKDCVFENLTRCGIWHSADIRKTQIEGNLFKNIGETTALDGKVWALALGDISNITDKEVTDCIIINNKFDTLLTAEDVSGTSHNINANFIAIVCDKVIIQNNNFNGLLGYGHDREGIYTKGNDVDISHNLLINAGSGEGYICCKPKAFKMSKCRTMNIHDNTITGDYGTGVMCYGTGYITNNSISIKKVYRAIRGYAISKDDYGTFYVKDNRIYCGTGSIAIDKNYAPENLISCGAEYLNGVYINDNSIAIDGEIPTLIKVNNVASDVEIKGNISSKAGSKNAIQLSQNALSKKITIDIEDNIFDTQNYTGIYCNVLGSEKTCIIKNNYIRGIDANNVAVTVVSSEDNNDVVVYESNQPANAFPKKHLRVSSKLLYTSLPSDYYIIGNSTKVVTL